jgi:hypothetical protein
MRVVQVWVVVVLAGFLLCVPVYSQMRPASLTGLIKDPTGAVIPGAKITLVNSTDEQRTTTSDGQGRYELKELPAGEYRLVAAADGFATSEIGVVGVESGRTLTRDIELKIAVVQERVEIGATASVDTEPGNNASAVTLSGPTLEALSDDPDDLSQDLMALAGPSAGPEGGEIYVDGFSGARLPPKSAIREVRINQNPFSAEYDRLGYGRVEIFTKPGADKFRGETRLNFGDAVLNARDPFAPTKPDYQRRMIEGTISGPLTRNSSFTVQVERRDIGQAALINALVLDPALNVVSYRDSVSNPSVNTEIGGRIDYQIGANHTLVGRYEWEKSTQTNAGIDTFSLVSRAYNTDEREHMIQITDTAVLSPRSLHEMRFQYRHSKDSYFAANSSPAIEVLGAFTGGGTSMGLNGLSEDRYEFQDILSVIRGPHAIKVGGRLRVISESNQALNDYNGVFTFTSLDAYRITEAGIHDGLSAAAIRAIGGGASQFAITAGNPVAALTQLDAGLFAQDDWRVRRNLTLSAGLRFEKQTNIDDWRSWAPRIGVAWGIGAGSNGTPFAVVRAGFGVFYDRIRESLVLDTRRINGIRQQQYMIPNPDFYPIVPSTGFLSGFVQNQAVRVLGPGLRSPYTQQMALSVERELVKGTTLSVTYMNSRGLHTLRSRNINAPLPDTGLRPLPGGNIYAYESSGRFRQHQVIANVNARITRRYSLFGYYTWSKARSDTDGAGTFPSDPYNFASEYGRAGFDTRHSAFVGGSMNAPLGLTFSPFVVIHSGPPFNIVTGEDLNGDSIFNDRPAWATDLTRPSVVRSKWGVFDLRPTPGQTIIPRNLGNGPGTVIFNLRMSKSIGFGGGSAEAQQVVTGAGLQGAQGPGGAHGGHGGHHDDSAGGGEKRFNLTFSISARNLLNKVNLASPVGNLSSPLFGTSTSLHGYGHGGGGANRTLELQTRFSF